MKRIFSSIIFLAIIFGLTINTYATTILSLAGDKDSLGTGLPLGTPLILDNAINTPSDGPFDQRMTTVLQWSHAYTIPCGESVISAAFTFLTWDIEDAGAGDGYGGGPYDDRLYVNGVEVAGAFDNVYTPDLTHHDIMTPNWVTIILDPSFYPILQTGSLNVQLDPHGGSYVDHVWIDFAELRVETSTTPVPEPSTMLLLGSGLIGLWGFRKKLKR